MRQIGFAVGSICVMLAYREAQAQGFWYVPPGADYSYRYGIDFGNGVGFGYSFGFGYGNLASPEVATAGAYSDLMRLQGQFSVMQPQFAIDGEAFDNVGFTYQEFQAAKSVDEQQVPTLQGETTEKGAVVQNPQPQPSHPQSILFPRLSPLEFDRATGKVVWPVALSRDPFSVHRSEMESLLKILAKSGVTSELNARVKEKTQELHDALRRQFRATPAKEYLEGHRFINRIANEAQVPVS